MLNGMVTTSEAVTIHKSEQQSLMLYANVALKRLAEIMMTKRRQGTSLPFEHSSHIVYYIWVSFSLLRHFACLLVSPCEVSKMYVHLGKVMNASFVLGSLGNMVAVYL
jgi:hypothetical protein